MSMLFPQNSGGSSVYKWERGWWGGLLSNLCRSTNFVIFFLADGGGVWKNKQFAFNWGPEILGPCKGKLGSRSFEIGIWDPATLKLGSIKDPGYFEFGIWGSMSFGIGIWDPGYFKIGN